MQKNTLAALVLGSLVGIGIASAGWSIAGAVREARESQRFVTVKGLAEREVDADLAIWPVTFKDTSDDLAELQRRVDAKREVVAGFPREELSFAVPRIQDRQTENTGQPGRPSGPRHLEQATLSAREAAAKFAKDSGSRVGRIRTASQGLFAVSDRDPNSPERKVVRVVTTVEYFSGD